MFQLDTSKLLAILNAAQSPALKKLLEDKAKATKAVDEARAQLADIETKLFAAVPPELKSLLAPAEPAKPRATRVKAEKSSLKRPDLQELKQILSELPDKTLSIRGEGYETRNIKVLAEANPHLFSYEKGTWPKVTYLK